MPRTSPTSQKKNYCFLARGKVLFEGRFGPHGVHEQGLSCILRQGVLYWLKVAATWPTETRGYPWGLQGADLLEVCSCSRASKRSVQCHQVHSVALSRFSTCVKECIFLKFQVTCILIAPHVLKMYLWLNSLAAARAQRFSQYIAQVCLEGHPEKWDAVGTWKITVWVTLPCDTHKLW